MSSGASFVDGADGCLIPVSVLGVTLLLLELVTCFRHISLWVDLSIECSL